MSYFFNGQLKEAEDLIESTMDICEKLGMGVGSISCQMFSSIITIAKGNIKQGFRKLEETQVVLLRNHMKVYYALSESILGEVYTKFIIAHSPSLLTLAKNIGLIVKIVPFAYKRAEEHFNKAIALFKEMGTKVNLG